MNKTPIQWTDSTWNPVLGCRRVSPGCEHCYAERLIAFRMSKNPKLPMYHDIARLTAKCGPQFTGAHRLLPDRLDEPLRARKGRKIFVCDMGDLFFEGHPFEEIAAVWGIMAAASWHTFQVLTKRPAQALAFFDWLDGGGSGCRTAELLRCAQKALEHTEALHELLHPRGRHIDNAIARPWPLPNVHLGVSVENQDAADRRIPLLLQIPAALHFLSCEPLLGPVDLTELTRSLGAGEHVYSALERDVAPDDDGEWNGATVEWVIAGGESGPGARLCDLAWLRALQDQCKTAGVPWFCKQLGADAVQSTEDARRHGTLGAMKDRHGGDMAEWPEDLRVRQFPEQP